ncbi:hypothetical protein BH11BAC5_BH11BAC5_53780 [soil metagenome]
MPFLRFSFCSTALVFFVTGLCLLQGVQANGKLTLSNLDEFRKAGTNWHLAGNVKADLRTHQQINLQDETDNIYLRLAHANSIEEMGEGLYLTNDKSYHLKNRRPGQCKT